MLCVSHARRFAPLILLGVLPAILTSPALAEIISVPPGLEPGDQYRLAFVTSTTMVATSTDIATYNDFVTASAESSAPLAAYRRSGRQLAARPRSAPKTTPHKSC